ncbi:hypothetical protein SK3146_01912 [Paenibacillus konkukensis]|uniref:Uncharacterized protein n=2 Tax=Paenibacillus TaxID=44249 RepID=A0ABY4RJV5_9BACL|nr:hypothetical protein SK3146_01912 [Paenibacillus konkukensis]
MVRLDDFYAVKVKRAGDDGFGGELIRLSADKEQGTHLFDIPVQADPQAVEEWAARALRAYREG